MASTSQSDSHLMRRLMRDGATPRSSAAGRRMPASPSYAGRDGYGREGHGREPAVSEEGLEGDVAQSIRSIERVVENFGVMKENFHFYKDLVADLREKLDDERAQREELGRELAVIERTVRGERDRAARAETMARESEDVIRDLESQLASLQAQTSRLVKAISLLVSAENDVRAEDGDGSLRLVS